MQDRNNINRKRFIISVLLLVTPLHTGIADDTYSVCPTGCDYTVIQDAIDNANDGDTIEVYSGTYPEDLKINIRLILRGVDIGGGMPDVQGASLSADGITLEGFLMTYWVSDDDCVYVNSNYNTIRNNNISYTDEAAIFLSGSYNNITGNTLNYNDYGIHSSNSRCNDIINNTIEGNSVKGILMRTSNNSNIISNIFNNNRNGIYLSDSNNNLIYNNYFNNIDNNAHDDSNNIWNIYLPPGINIIGGPYLGGNYWSDFNDPCEGCTDIDDNGICDCIHSIPGGSSIDQYPLVGWEYRWTGEGSEGGSAVTTGELQDAIHHWLDDIPINEHILTIEDLQYIIAIWL